MASYISARFFLLLVTGIIFSFITPLLVFGHGSGSSFETSVDGYIVDVGYNTFDIASNRPVRFDFALINEETGENISFSDVLVQFKTADQSIFAGRIYKPEAGLTVMTHTFPSAGDYTLVTKFQNNGEVVAEASFSFAVAANEEEGRATPPNSMLFVILSGLVGLGLGFFLGRGNKSA